MSQLDQGEPTDKANSPEQEATDKYVHQLEYLWGLLEQQKEYLIKQEDQSISSARQLISIAGISIIPTLLGDVKAFNHRNLICLTVGLVFLFLAVGIGCFDLAQKREAPEVKVNELRNLIWKIEPDDYGTSRENYLRTLIDQEAGNLETDRHAQDNRIQLTKIGYRLYAVALFFIVAAFVF